MDIRLLLIEPWDAWRPATCMPAACFCETVHAALIRQPANTWSSLAFVVVAGVIVWQNAPALPRVRGAVHWLYLLALLWIGIGSAFYHASLTYWGQFADVSGMYVLGTVALLARAQQHRRLTRYQVTARFIALNAVLLWLLWVAPQLRRYAFAALVIALVAQESAAARAGAAQIASQKLLRRALAVLVLGLVIWSVDLLRVVCAPATVVQGHAVWHVLAAISAGMLYLYLQSDTEPGIARPPLP